MDFNCTLRVLVIEPDLGHRPALVRQLEGQAFKVYYAEGEGPALLDDAQNKVNLFRCHVVVLAPPSPHLTDPDVYLEPLVERFAPAGIVLYTAEADDRLAFEAGRRGLEYVRRDEPRSHLFAAVEAQGRQSCRCHLEVAWPTQADTFANDVMRTLKMQPDQITPDDLYDLLGRAFRQAAAVDLDALLPFEQESGPVRRAVLLWVRERHHLTSTRRIPKVVKIGPSGSISREMQNYYRYVDGWLFQNRQARLENYTLLWHLGAIVYAFLGASPEQMVPFCQFYQQNVPQASLAVLRRLFVDTCRNWYQEEREQMTRTRLFELYNRRLGIEEKLQRLDTATPQLTFPDYPDPLPNPAYWVAETGMETVFDQATTCIAHGDLHADNFFVDHNDMAWLIDFEHTGPAHALCDFVELEADIKLRLTPFAGDELAALAALERSLMADEALTAMLVPSARVAADPNLYKAFEVLAGLRHLAHIATGITDPREYLHALLYETLFMATLSRLSPGVQRRALFSAALIVERLARPVGFADGGPSVPRLDLVGRQGQPDAHAAIQAHKAHLHAIYQAATLQKSLYQGALPPELERGLALIREEAAQAQRASEML